MEGPGTILTRILSMMALVPRILYFLEGLEAACLMAHVVLPAAGRPTIIRIYKNGTKRDTEAVAVGGMVAWHCPHSLVTSRVTQLHGCLWKTEAITASTSQCCCWDSKTRRVSDSKQRASNGASTKSSAVIVNITFLFRIKRLLTGKSPQRVMHWEWCT